MLILKDAKLMLLKYATTTVQQFSEGTNLDQAVLL